MILDAEDDIERLLYLYSESNALESDTLDYWKSKIRALCTSGNTFMFVTRELVRDNTIHGVIPTSVHVSLNHLTATSGDEFIASVDHPIFKKRIGEYSGNGGNSWWAASAKIIHDFTDGLSHRAQPHPSSQRYISMELLAEAEDIITRYAGSCDEHASIRLLHAEDPRLESYSLLAFVHRAAAAEAARKGYRSSSAEDRQTNKPVKNCLISILQHLQDDDELHTLVMYMLAKNAAALSADGKVVKIRRRRGKRSTGHRAERRSSYVFSFFNSSIAPLSDSIDAAETDPTMGTSALAVTETDVARIKLKVNITVLQKKVDDLEGKIESLSKNALRYKRSGNNTRALMELSLKRNAVQTRDKIQTALGCLLEAKERIDDAGINVIIIDAYRTATDGMRHSREQAGLTVDTIEEVIDAFQDEMDEMNAISGIIEGGGLSGVSTSTMTAEQEQELENELAELMGSSGSDSASHSASSISISATPTSQQLAAVEALSMSSVSSAQSTDSYSGAQQLRQGKTAKYPGITLSGTESEDENDVSLRLTLSALSVAADGPGSQANAEVSAIAFTTDRVAPEKQYGGQERRDLGGYESKAAATSGAKSEDAEGKEGERASCTDMKGGDRKHTQEEVDYAKILPALPQPRHGAKKRVDDSKETSPQQLSGVRAEPVLN